MRHRQERICSRQHNQQAQELENMSKEILLKVVAEQQETIAQQSRLIADLVTTLESWEQTAGYDGAELKKRAGELRAER